MDMDHRDHTMPLKYHSLFHLCTHTMIWWFGFLSLTNTFAHCHHSLTTSGSSHKPFLCWHDWRVRAVGLETGHHVLCHVASDDVCVNHASYTSRPFSLYSKFQATGTVARTRTDRTHLSLHCTGAILAQLLVQDSFGKLIVSLLS